MPLPPPPPPPVTISFVVSGLRVAFGDGELEGGGRYLAVFWSWKTFCKCHQTMFGMQCLVFEMSCLVFVVEGLLLLECRTAIHTLGAISFGVGD